MLNIKVVLSTILRNYRVSSNRRPSKWTLVAEMTLKRREGFPVCFHPRQKAPLLQEIINNTKNIDINHNVCDFSFKKTS